MVRPLGSPDVLAAHFGQRCLHDGGAFFVGRKGLQNGVGQYAALGISAQKIGKEGHEFWAHQLVQQDALLGGEPVPIRAFCVVQAGQRDAQRHSTFSKIRLWS